MGVGFGATTSGCRFTAAASAACKMHEISNVTHAIGYAGVQTDGYVNEAIWITIDVVN